MKSFWLSYDTKHMSWDRAIYSVEANTIEEAVDKLKQHVQTIDGVDGVSEPYYEDLLETRSEMTPEENDGYSTIEIMDRSDPTKPPLWENGRTLSTTT